MNVSLKGKRAVVCGSSQGIGLAVAKELAAQGAECVLIARYEKDLVKAVESLSTADGQQHSYLLADFGELQQIKKAIEKLQRMEVDILVNNTGGPKAGPIATALETDFVNAFQQHLLVNHMFTKAVIPSMKLRGYGRIINIVSTSVKVPIDNLGVSNTTRAAVAGWAKTMANELGQFQITVNNVLPGYTDTKRLNNLIDANAERRGVTKEVIKKEMIESIPAKRFAEASEIASVVCFLASPAASYVNGVSLRVDGGKTGAI